MINLLLGAPGGGKSYEAVAYHVLPALQSGRKVITNLPLNIELFAAIVPGCENLIEIRTKTKGIKPEPQVRQLFGRDFDSSGADRWIDRPFAHIEDYRDEWRDENGRGPIYVIDECHFCLPLNRTEIAVEEWYSMHRHYNVDVLLITQSYGKCSRAIIDLVQVCYRVRKATAFGNSNGYIRKVLDGVRGSVISTQQRKYDKKFFPLYKSHTHGTALAESDPDDVSPFIVIYKRITRTVWILALISLVYSFWPSNRSLLKNQDQKPEQNKEMVAPINETNRFADKKENNEVEIEKESEAKIEKVSEIDPLAGKQIHVTGYMSMGSKKVITFVVSDSGMRIFDLTDKDLSEMGYGVLRVSDCVVILRFGDKSRPVVCDAPSMYPATQEKPIVYDSSNNRWSNKP